MNRFSAIPLLLATIVLTGCNTPPPPRNAELLRDGPFPNLSEVPARPPIMPLVEREQLRRELIQNNSAIQQGETK